MQQSGNVTPGHSACWAITGVLFDCGAPGGGVSVVGSTTQNDFAAFNGSGSLIDSGINPSATSNWSGLQNFNGGATAPTRTAGDDTTNVATTAFVKTAISSLNFVANEPLTVTFPSNVATFSFDYSYAGTFTGLQTFSAGIVSTAITQASTGQLFQNNGATVDRFNDRILVGGATLYNPANCCVETGTWLAAANLHGLNGVVADTYIASQYAGDTPLFVAAQSALSASASPATYPITFLVANNNATYQTAAWGIYGECYQQTSTGGTGGALACMELDVRNNGGITYINDPYHWGGEGYTTGYEAGCGAGQATYTTNNCSGALLIFGNFNSFDSGITFAGPAGMARDSIAASGPNGERLAITMPEAYSICSYSAAATINVCEQGESGIWSLRGPSKQILFTVNVVGSATNYVSILPGATGNAAIITSLGSDTNVNLLLSAQGSGVVALASPLAAVKQVISEAAATIASAAGAVLDDVDVVSETTTITGTTNITTSTGFNKVSIYTPTYTDSSAVTITNAATLFIQNAPATGGMVTITNPWALWVPGGKCYLPDRST